MENKVAVLGDSDFVMPFSALGMDTFPVTQDPEQITESAQKILEQRYVLVVIPENIARIADQVFSIRKNSPTPCVVVVPFTMCSV